MPAVLVSLDGHPHIPLDRVLIVVGRDLLCDVRLLSGRISRRHCCLALDGDGVLVRDLGSTNGTHINGRRVESGVLRPGDELSIAHIRFRLEEGHDDCAGPPADRVAPEGGQPPKETVLDGTPIPVQDP